MLSGAIAEVVSEVVLMRGNYAYSGAVGSTAYVLLLAQLQVNQPSSAYITHFDQKSIPNFAHFPIFSPQ